MRISTDKTGEDYLLLPLPDKLAAEQGALQSLSAGWSPEPSALGFQTAQFRGLARRNTSNLGSMRGEILNTRG